MGCNPKIAEWFFDEFENIIDELVCIIELRQEIINENDVDFEEVIRLQSYDEFVRGIAITCSCKLGLSYEEVYDELENKLEELYHAFDNQ